MASFSNISIESLGRCYNNEKRKHKRIALREKTEITHHPVALCVTLSYVESGSCSYQFYFHIVNKLLSHSLEVMHLCNKARELLLIVLNLLEHSKIQF